MSRAHTALKRSHSRHRPSRNYIFVVMGYGKACLFQQKGAVWAAPFEF
jgi:hypothetical protein